MNHVGLFRRPRHRMHGEQPAAACNQLQSRRALDGACSSRRARFARRIDDLIAAYDESAQRVAWTKPYVRQKILKSGASRTCDSRC
jgi:hypothetical protein